MIDIFSAFSFKPFLALKIVAISGSMEVTTAKPKLSSKGDKKALKNAKKPKVASKKPATHPTVAKMVSDAIHTLNQKNGTSVVAIKKYLSDTYKVDTDKLAPFIKRFLAKSVLNNTYIQVTGNI